MPRPSSRLMEWFGADDVWERPRPGIGRQDVVLSASVGAVSLLALELMRSAGGFEHTDVPVWAQLLAVSTGAALLLGRRRWPLSVASAAALHMFVAGVTMPEVMAQLSLQVIASFVPPVSAVVMPKRILAGGVEWWEPLVALGLLAVFAAVTVWVGERLYRRALLQTGGRVSLRQAWSAAE